MGIKRSSKWTTKRTNKGTAVNRRKHFVGLIEGTEDRRVRLNQAIAYLRAVLDDSADDVQDAAVAELVAVADAKGATS